MAKGLDVAEDATPHIADLVDAQYQFVGRYYNVNRPSKNLTRAEAEALSAAGLSIVVVWENGFPTSAAYFSNARGVSDGNAAHQYASGIIQQPEGSAIYFAVDYDASRGDVDGVVTEYFRGVRAALQASESPYRAGVYGSGATCGALLDKGLVSYAWLSQSTKFRGSKTFKRWHIKQGPEATICGMDADSDQARGEYGAFQVLAAIPDIQEV